MDKQENSHPFLSGCRDGIPIGLGYLAVSFSLGIFAKSVGISSLQGFFASLFTIASAGEYAAFTLIGQHGAYIEMALVILVTNCRYLLMSAALSQKLKPGTPLIHRIGMGAFVTDEIFGASIAQKGYAKPAYTYGLAATSVVPWALGTMLGIIAGEILPAIVVTALSVALYGMFIAIIIPPARKDRVIAVLICVSFALSYAFSFVPWFRENEGMKIIILTVVTASAAAVIKPVKDEEEENG